MCGRVPHIIFASTYNSCSISCGQGPNNCKNMCDAQCGSGCGSFVACDADGCMSSSCSATGRE